MLWVFGMLVIPLAIGAIWASKRGNGENSRTVPGHVSLGETKDPATGGRHYTVSIPTDRQQARESQSVWEVFQEILKVERFAPLEDPEQRARDAAKRDFNLLKERVKEFEAQELEGEDLYAALEQRLIDENAEGALKMLDGYRRLGEALATDELDGMSPEDRFEYVVKARRDAFGEETAERLFFEKEAYTRYKLEEEAITEDTGLTAVEKQAEIISRRNTLQVDLASRGSYVSFADERRSELDQRLRERYGESVETMSVEERRAVILDLYREELPPETLERVEQVLAAQAARRSAFEAYRSESEAILNDQDLSFDEQEERLADLSAQYEPSP